MDEYEQYLFDLKGWVVVPDALTPAQVQDLRGRLDEVLEARRRRRDSVRCSRTAIWDTNAP
eukprot:SAG31_NODE_20575_length_570_cov_1.312102_1_plen_60_part_01